MMSLQSNELRQEIAAMFSHGKILDIGFAQMPNPFLNGEVHGLDLYLPRRKPRNYANMLKGSISELVTLYRKSSFDTIIALEVIEHIDSHLKFFKDANLILKPRGSLIISTPSPYYYRTMIGNMFFPKGKAGTPDHISIYAPRILNRVASRAGFELEAYEHVSKLPLPFFSYQSLYVYRVGESW